MKDSTIHSIQSLKIDDRRNIIIIRDKQAAIQFAVEDFIIRAGTAIKSRGHFFVALSGGSTPEAIYKMISSTDYRNKIDWQKVYLFFSDERCVPSDNPESNYHMAMTAGLASLPIPSEQIIRLIGEGDPQENANIYEQQIKALVPDHSFDLMMLGMGDDGHTASLFPGTKALDNTKNLCAANWVEQKNTWRLTLTYPCINAARAIIVYVLGENKKEILAEVLFNDKFYPIQGVGTVKTPALFISDEAAGQIVKSRLKQ